MSVMEAPVAGETPAAGDAATVTPSVRQAGRRSIPWIVLAAVALIVALLGVLVSGGQSSVGVPLDAGNAGPVGGKAVAEVLRQHGVDVHTATSLRAVQDAASDDTTVLVYDHDGNLDSAAYDALTSIASAVVVVEPDFVALQRLAPGVAAAGSPADRILTAGCTVPAAQKAQTLDPRPSATVKGTGDPGTFRVTRATPVGCFAAPGGRYSFVQTTYDGRAVALVGSASVLMNDGVDRAGNAALALNALGGHRTLVWYLPGLFDRPVTGPPDLSSLTPGWVTPVVILMILVFVAAAFWRGRRFGPLVIENLPVVVHAGETREGRARLYQRSSARLRAADALRIGALGRLAGHAGLPRAATASQIADAVSALTVRDRSRIRALLLDAVPRTDADLLALSDDLAELERATARAVLPEQPGPTGRMDA